jgi:hypothetical protein
MARDRTAAAANAPTPTQPAIGATVNREDSLGRSAHRIAVFRLAGIVGAAPRAGVRCRDGRAGPARRAGTPNDGPRGVTRRRNEQLNRRSAHSATPSRRTTRSSTERRTARQSRASGRATEPAFGGTPRLGIDGDLRVEHRMTAATAVADGEPAPIAGGRCSCIGAAPSTESALRASHLGVAAVPAATYQHA